jgi:rRNA-processing protein EBP2
MPQGFGSLVASKKRKRLNGDEGEKNEEDETDKAASSTIEPLRRRRSAKQVEDDDDAEMLEEARAAGFMADSFSSQQQQQKHMNNQVGLRAALAEIRLDLPWVERLEVVSAEKLEASLPQGVADDLKVELAFYGQALAAVTAARGELERVGVPHRRPDDYLAEMLKSDVHMAKIRNKLVVEAKHAKESERKQREKNSQAFSKELRTAKLSEKAQDKRKALDNIKSWRKKSRDSRPELSTEKDLDSVLHGEKRASRPAEKSDRRKGKDKKYGHGGIPRRIAKENDKKSASDMRGFSVKRMKSTLPPGFSSAKRSSGGKGSSRPGKWARSSKGKGGGGGKRK